MPIIAVSARMLIASVVNGLVTTNRCEQSALLNSSGSKFPTSCPSPAG